MAQPRKSFTTEKGTELPILNLRGKEYLQVAHRLVWFREANPQGIIKTSMLAMQGEGPTEYAVFKTEIYINGVMVASGHKKETRAGFDDFIEKAETGSIGRALAMAGYGTQFCSDEMEEGNRLADAPLERVDKALTAVVDNPSSDASVVGQQTTGRRPSFRKNVAVVPSAKGDDI